MTYSKIESRVPDWLWSPRDHWSRYKGFGRILIFGGVISYFLGYEPGVSVLFVLGIALYGVGLLGMRMKLEGERK